MTQDAASRAADKIARWTSDADKLRAMKKKYAELVRVTRKFSEENPMTARRLGFAAALKGLEDA